MKILNFEFTKANAYELAQTVAKYMIPSGIGGILIGTIFKDPTLSASAVAVINAVIYFVELLTQPSTDSGTLPTQPTK